MGVYAKKSLELLREKIDLIEVVSSYVNLKPAGSAYKGICPFHEEKTPSFMIQKGESHYHCFGCGAHGDAIAFLMSYMKMSFVEAVDTLAERFQVPIEEVEYEKRHDGPSKKDLKEVLQKAAGFYHTYLLHSDEGHIALKYLYDRGLDLEFIRLFKIGFAPKRGILFGKFMQKHRFTADMLEKSGLIKTLNTGKKKAFFVNRITFPILDVSGSVIGFSARKIDEESFGPKYINTPETPLFKKSHTLYGLSFSRRRIAKDKRAIVVEGQIDALRLIQAGFNITVAGQGTAFTEEHVKELLNLGITKVYLALDGDEAGATAASKIGNLFQKEGVEVYVVPIPIGMDPDSILKEQGPLAFTELLEKSADYLSFLLSYFSKETDLSSPSQKNHLIQTIVQRIRSWDHPLMVHESLRKLARLTQVPEKLVGVGQEEVRRSTYVKREGSLSEVDVNPERVIETDLLRWLYLLSDSSPKLFQIIKENLRPEHFSTPICRRLFSHYMDNIEEEKSADLLALANNLESPEEQLLFSEIVQKKVNTERAEEGVIETVTKMLQRHWMEERERIKIQIQSGRCSEEEILELAKKFDGIKGSPPLIKIPENL
ncbi:MAG: DNA primase [Simkaniaceae bacterium]|nr:MAG: DNA primase [Simkaniaceae bacterium]